MTLTTLIVAILTLIVAAIGAAATIHPAPWRRWLRIERRAPICVQGSDKIQLRSNPDVAARLPSNLDDVEFQRMSLVAHFEGGGWRVFESKSGRPVAGVKADHAGPHQALLMWKPDRGPR